jgi:hypothetical protein
VTRGADTIYVGVDPSVHATGVAVVHVTQELPPRLHHARVVEAKTIDEATRAAARWGRTITASFAADYLIVELPRVYPTAKQEGDPNSLIAIAAVAGAWAASVRCGEIHYRNPSDWKGQLNKDVVAERVAKRMGIDVNGVYALVDAREPLKHNAIEAIGLALAGLRGRL